MAVPLLAGCATTTANGDAGCDSYAIARASMPPPETITSAPDAWAGWVADLDDRMTGACRG